MKLFLFIFLLFHFLVFSCKNTTNPIELENKLYITVKDSTGHYVKDAGLHFFYDYCGFRNVYTKKYNSYSYNSLADSTEPVILPKYYLLEQNYPNPTDHFTVIGFAIPKETFIRLEVVDRNDSTKIMKTLKTSLLAPGRYSVNWNGRDENGVYVPNNIYKYRLITDSLSLTKNLFIDDVFPEFSKTTPIARSNIKGEIIVDYDVFPIGISTPYLDEQGNLLGTITIPNEISLIVTKGDFTSSVKKVTIDDNQPMELSFIIK